MKKSPEIFKIQRPLSHFGPGKPQALVYNRDRSINFQAPLDSNLDELFGEDEPKIYVMAYVDDDGALFVETDTPVDQAQGW